MNLLIANAINLLVALFSVTILVTGEGYKLAPFGLAIISLCMITKTFNVKRNKEINQILFAFIAFFAVTVLSLLMYSGETNNADMPSRTLLGVTLLLLLLKYPPKLKWLTLSIIIGSYLAGFIALYFTLELNRRAFLDLGYMVIQSGDIAMSLGIFSTIISIYYFQLNKRLTAFLSVGGALLGIMASLLSGARGGWVFSFLILIAILFINRNLISQKLQLLSAATLFIILAAAYPLAEKRVSSAISEVEHYIVDNKSNTSTGYRFELWKSAYYSFIDKPIFGQGFDGILQSKLQQVAEEKISNNALRYERSHNIFFAEAATKGIIGLMVLLMFFFAPLNLFRKNYQQAKTIEQKTINLLGLSHILLTMGYGMTQNFINHHSGMLYYVVYSCIFIAISFHLATENRTN